MGESAHKPQHSRDAMPPACRATVGRLWTITLSGGDMGSAAELTFYRKTACIDSQSYFGYVASGEELKDGLTDYSEIFTITKDLELDDPRKNIESLWQTGEKLLRLIELGIDVPEGSLTLVTKDGDDCRRIGSHPDYGLLVITTAVDVRVHLLIPYLALFVRPPYKDEVTAGMKEDSDAENVFTVFPGGMMRYMTNAVLPSTLHKVGFNMKERLAFACFHEPNFQAIFQPLPGYEAGQGPEENYPGRITTHRLVDEGRYK
ncbi:hypothetical protein BKA56DRAFT_635530 [Ilyonectria sp. MPI-CAGE-AT-0026]|nr:hypothetical protein BKA56DRAFT_635530 [Ilyonectria sp. MPI-CAGE-AT-0026]